MPSEPHYWAKFHIITYNKAQQKKLPYFKRTDSPPSDAATVAYENQPLLGGEHYLTDRELSERLKISRRTLQDYRNNGVLPYRQLGGKILYRESDIEKMLQENYRKANS